MNCWHTEQLGWISREVHSEKMPTHLSPPTIHSWSGEGILCNFKSDCVSCLFKILLWIVLLRMKTTCSSFWNPLTVCFSTPPPPWVHLLSSFWLCLFHLHHPPSCLRPAQDVSLCPLCLEYSFTCNPSGLCTYLRSLTFRRKRGLSLDHPMENPVLSFFLCPALCDLWALIFTHVHTFWFTCLSLLSLPLESIPGMEEFVPVVF